MEEIKYDVQFFGGPQDGKRVVLTSIHQAPGQFVEEKNRQCVHFYVLEAIASPERRMLLRYVYAGAMRR